MAGMFDNITESWKRRGQSVWDIAEDVNKGERSYAELALAGASNATGAVFDLPASAIGAVLELPAEFIGPYVPDNIKQGFSDVVQQVYDTEAAKAASHWMKENPRATQNILNAVELVGNLSGTNLSRTAIPDAALQSPSKLTGFYGGGQLGKAGSVLREGVTKTIPNLARTYLSPTQAAMHREGLPLPLQRQTRMVADDSFWNRKAELSSEIKALEQTKKTLDKNSVEYPSLVAAIDKKRAEIKKMNEEVSFVEGQAEQTRLLNQSRGRESFGILGDFEAAQGSKAGAFTPDVIYQNLNESQRLKNQGIVVDREMANTLYNRMAKAWEIDPTKSATTETFIRQDNMFSDISRANQTAHMDTKASKTSTLLRRAGELWNEYNPTPNVGTVSFNSVEDLKNFAALTQLGDKTLMRKANRAKGIESRRPANKAERVFYKLTESDRFAPRDDNSEIVKKMFYYLKYTDALKNGERLNKKQQAIYDNILSDMSKIKNNMEVDSSGRVYLSGSHSSAVKALGGVNDQFVIDLRGNVVNMVSDENDLFSLRVPGDKRMMTVVEPNVYNIFGMESKSKPIVKQQQAKKRFTEALAEKGTPKISKTREGMLQQFSQAVEKRKREIQPTAADYGRVAQGYGVLGAMGSRQLQEENQQ